MDEAQRGNDYRSAVRHPFSFAVVAYCITDKRYRTVTLILGKTRFKLGLGVLLNFATMVLSDIARPGGTTVAGDTAAVAQMH